MSDRFFLLSGSARGLLHRIRLFLAGGLVAGTGLATATPGNATTAPSGPAMGPPAVSVVNRNKKASKLVLRLTGISDRLSLGGHRSHRSHSSHRSHYSSSGGSAPAPSRESQSTQSPVETPAATDPDEQRLTIKVVEFNRSKLELVGEDLVGNRVTFSCSNATKYQRNKSTPAVPLSTWIQVFVNEDPFRAGQKFSIVWKPGGADGKSRMATAVTALE